MHKFWDDKKLTDLFRADTNQLDKLAIILGENPRTFYQYANLSGIDQTKQDTNQYALNNPDIEPYSSLKHPTIKKTDHYLDRYTKVDAVRTEKLSLLLSLYKAQNEIKYQSIAVRNALNEVFFRKLALNRNRETQDLLIKYVNHIRSEDDVKKMTIRITPYQYHVSKEWASIIDCPTNYTITALLYASLYASLDTLIK